MRFKSAPKPKSYDRRIVRSFLLFPRKIQNEIVWLEFVYYRQTWGWDISMFKGRKNWKWVDREDYVDYVSKETYEKYKVWIQKDKGTK